MVERLMRQMGLRGATQGKSFKVTTLADKSATRPDDSVERNFTAQLPNQLWIADLTYVCQAGQVPDQRQVVFPLGDN